LHQSDLLILDYHLNSLDPSDNTDCLNVLNQLASKPHFNLVIIYTAAEENEEEKTLEEVGIDIYLSLKTKDIIKEEIKNYAIDLLEEKELKYDELLTKITLKDVYCFLSGIEINKSNFRYLFTQISELEDSELIKILPYLFRQKINNYIAGVTSKIDSNLANEVPWIRSDNIFIAIVSKRVEPKNIIDKLKKSLVNWNPDPLKLLFSKAKIEINEHGFKHEDLYMDDLAHASWLYYTLHKLKNSEDANNEVKELYNRILSSYSNQIIPSLIEFGNSLLNTLKLGTDDCAIKKHYKYDISTDKNSLVQALNRFQSCAPSHDNHITLGSIIKNSNDQTLWICLNCACDLEPEQYIPWQNTIGKWKPVTVVKLHNETSVSNSLKQATTKKYLFIEDKVFRFIEKNKINPHCEVIFAKNKGKFTQEKIEIKRFIINEDNNPALSKENYEFVVNLRYEYACMFLQQLNNHNSRIGVDFINKF